MIGFGCYFSPLMSVIAMLQGTEKVILMQEQLAKNRILIEMDSQQQIMASVHSSTHERKTKTGITSKHGQLMLRHNTFK